MPALPRAAAAEAGTEACGTGLVPGLGKVPGKTRRWSEGRGRGALGPGALPALPQPPCLVSRGLCWLLVERGLGGEPAPWALGMGLGCLLLSCHGGLPDGPLRPAPPRPGPHAGPGKAGGVQSHSGRPGREWRGWRARWAHRYRPATATGSALLLRLLSRRRSRFSSRRRASSASWCCRHLWKFSTTTPTNMLSTKKLTMSRKEMKYSSIQGLWFCTGCGTEAVGPRPPAPPGALPRMAPRVPRGQGSRSRETLR